MYKVNGKEILSIDDIKAMEYPTQEDFTDAVLWLCSRVEELEEALKNEQTVRFRTALTPIDSFRTYERTKCVSKDSL